MKQECVLGIDIGTSSTKAVLARLDGSIEARSQRPHALSLPRQGWAEHDAEETWWKDVRDLCRELTPKAGRLGGVCVSGIGPAIVPCDGRRQPLRPAILYGIDTRAEAEIAELEECLGSDAILARCGSALSSQSAGPKLLWIKRNAPEVWAETSRWHTASSFVVSRLTGSYVVDHHSASQCTPFYDLSAGAWADDWAGELTADVPFPELVWPADQVGEVTRAAADATGLPRGTPVVAGTIDAWAEAFSVGVRRPGDLMIMYGSTMFFIQVVETPTPHRLLWCTPGVQAGSRTLAAGMTTSGSLTEWIRTLSGSPDWDTLTSEAGDVPPGAAGVLMLPYFAGERTPIYDPQARGVIAGLTLRHGRSELLRATYEAIAYGARQILELFEQASGAPSRVTAVGGGVRASVWPQIVSDVVGLEQLLPLETIGASYGDALLAAIGTGLVSPATDWSSTQSTIRPSASARATYDELYSLYGALYANTIEIVHRLAAIGEAGKRPDRARPRERTS